MSCYNDTSVITREWIAGDTEEFVINYLNPDRTPIDMTGATALMQLKRKATDTVTSLSMTGEIDLPTGKIVFTALPSETRSLLPSGSQIKYVFDIEVTFNPEYVKTLLDGVIIVKTDVSR